MCQNDHHMHMCDKSLELSEIQNHAHIYVQFDLSNTSTNKGHPKHKNVHPFLLFYFLPLVPFRRAIAREREALEW